MRVECMHISLVAWIHGVCRPVSACICRGKKKPSPRRLPRPKRKLRQTVRGGEGAKGDERKEAARGGKWEILLCSHPHLPHQMRMSTQQQAPVFKGVARARENRRARASRGSWRWRFQGKARAKCWKGDQKGTSGDRSHNSLTQRQQF